MAIYRMCNRLISLGLLISGRFLFHPSLANEQDGYIGSCLNAWGKHPCGSHPRYKPLASSVKVFGIGQNTDDLIATKKPELALVEPA
jgi:hypothetical protein